MFAIVLFLLLFVPASGWTATYYVATTGNNATSCVTAQNIGTPKQTIGNALSCLGPGDTLLIRGGTYQESLTFGTFPAGTSWNAPVTIKGYPSETAVWQATPGCAYPQDCRFPVYLRSSSEQYIIFDSIIFDGNNFTTNLPLIEADNVNAPPQHVKFTNIEGRNYISNFVIHHARDVSVLNSSFHDNRQTSFFFIPSAPGFYISDVQGLLLDHLTIYNITSYGIQVYDGGNSNSTGIVFSNSVMHHTGTLGGQGGIVIADTSDMLVYNNVFYLNGQSDGSAGNAIAIGHGSCASNVRVYNNTVTANYSGARDGAAAVYVQCGSGHVIQNNIIWNNNGTDYVVLGGSVTQDHNLIGANPLFVNEAGHDYHLQSGSPAINTGVAISQVVNDYAGTPRPQGAGYDIGAYAYRSSPTPVIPSPRNLRIAAP